MTELLPVVTFEQWLAARKGSPSRAPEVAVRASIARTRGFLARRASPDAPPRPVEVPLAGLLSPIGCGRVLPERNE